MTKERFKMTPVQYIHCHGCNRIISARNRGKPCPCCSFINARNRRPIVGDSNSDYFNRCPDCDEVVPWR